MHMFCRGCFFEYGTKMAADALARGGGRPGRTWTRAALELAGCAGHESRCAARHRCAPCCVGVLRACVSCCRRALAAAGAGEGISALTGTAAGAASNLDSSSMMRSSLASTAGLRSRVKVVIGHFLSIYWGSFSKSCSFSRARRRLSFTAVCEMPILRAASVCVSPCSAVSSSACFSRGLS